MNSKFIILFYLVASVIAALLTTQICSYINNQQLAAYNQNSMYAQLYYDPSYLIGKSYCGDNGQFMSTYSSGINLSTNTSNNIKGVFDSNSGVSTNSLGIGTFLDLARLLISFVSVLTGYSMIAFFVAVGTPTILIYMVFVPLFFIYLLSLIEFFTGRVA